MLGLGLRSTQSPGISAGAATPVPVVVSTLIGESFDGATISAIIPNPFSPTNSLVAKSLTNWAQGHECVAGVSAVEGDPTSTEGWGTMVLSDGITYNAQVVGWQVDSNGTASSNTGPSNPPVSRTNSNVDATATASNKYLYTEGTETSSAYNAENRIFIARTPGVNFSQSMVSQSNNIRISFQIHGFGTRIGEFRLYVADTSTTTEGDSALVFSMSEFAQTESASPWTPVSFTLNSVDIPALGVTDMRTTDSDFYFYLVHEPDTNAASAFTCDLAIDNFYIEEMG